jgi:hypothetical protein
MHLRLEHLTDQELDHLAELYDDLTCNHYTRGLQEFSADMVDVLKVERARRMIAAAEHRDPLAYCWFGRL